jgi:hypothetical protein
VVLKPVKSGAAKPLLLLMIFNQCTLFKNVPMLCSKNNDILPLSQRLLSVKKSYTSKFVADTFFFIFHKMLMSYPKPK